MGPWYGWIDQEVTQVPSRVIFHPQEVGVGELGDVAHDSQNRLFEPPTTAHQIKPVNVGI